MSDEHAHCSGVSAQKNRRHWRSNAAVTPGDKIVRIVGLRSTGKMVEAGPPAPKGTLIPQLEQCVPSHYNDQSRLRADITPGKANTHNFELDSKSVRGVSPK